MVSVLHAVHDVVNRAGGQRALVVAARPAVEPALLATADKSATLLGKRKVSRVDVGLLVDRIAQVGALIPKTDDAERGR